MNQIPDRQNTAPLLALQAAKTCSYDKARRLSRLQVLVTVVFPCMLAVVKSLDPAITPWIAAYGLAVLVIDPELDEWQRGLRATAARFQEVFDRTLLEIPWSTEALGAAPSSEEVAEAASKYRDRSAEWRDWYPREVGELPLAIARIVCQRINGWWDHRVRLRYASALSIVFYCGCSLVLIVAAIRQQSLLQIASVGTLLAPVARWTRRTQRAHRASAEGRRRVFEWTERICKEATAGTPSERDLELSAREIQRETFEQRKTSPLIPQWLYRHTREQLEQDMRSVVRAIIKDGPEHRG